jgi:tetratricopeptide (TPR) repeat protein
MGTVRQASRPLRENPRSISQAKSNRQPRFLLWYWAFTRPRHGRILRVAFIQPGLGLLLALGGWLAGLLGWFSLSLPAGLIISAVGGVILLLSYLISRVYHKEYPGRFNARLEEYVARRVSRLSEAEFIPHYETKKHQDKENIERLNLKVCQAIRVELARLAQSAHTVPAPVCGVLVTGPKHTNKTGALWDTMGRELRGWTFVRWPHHMDHPANLALRVGHRIVLWIDNLHDFAHPGEAAALAQFIQEVCDNGRQLMVLASCRDRQDYQEAERHLSPLMKNLRSVLAEETLPPTEQVEELKQAYENLTPRQKSVLHTMDWLQSLRVFTYPEEMLRELNGYFLDPTTPPDVNLTWEDTINGLGDNAARFVRVDQRADPKTHLSDETYNFADWVQYNLLNRLPRPHKVVEPINVHYLNLEGPRAERARKITDILEHEPAAIIQLLAGYPVAAETLILLGDAYLNHLGETIENATQLAIKCYDGALEQLDSAHSPEEFPGAWAAAHIGKGTAELRLERLTKADVDFRLVAEQEEPHDGVRPIPMRLRARALHGRGDVIAAQIPSDAAATQLDDAATYYERAAEKLVRSDPLWAETKLDRANVLYEIALAAVRQYEQSLASVPGQPPTLKIISAQEAYREAQQVYSQAAAPAVWAEIQRRNGELCLMEMTWLIPANVLWPHRPVAASVAVDNPEANEKEALEKAKLARDYFIAAHSVFAPSYLPMTWLQTQEGLVRALLIIGRIVTKESTRTARDIYASCLDTTKAAVQRVASPADAPLDWVDLQLLRVHAELGLALLGEADAQANFQHASKVLKKIADLLNGYVLLPGNPSSERISAQKNEMNPLADEIRKAPRDI